MRYRVTIRGEGIELRGYSTSEGLGHLSGRDKPYVVVASPTEDAYNPFSNNLTPEEATAVDRQMNEHMLHHKYIANTAHMACDTQCRIDALSEAIRQHVLIPRGKA